ISGQALETVWPKLKRTEKAALMREIGQVMARMHGLPVGKLKDLDPEWEVFISGQHKKCLERHRRLGMPDWFLAELSGYEEMSLSSLLRKESVILTGEYTPFNLLVDGGP